MLAAYLGISRSLKVVALNLTTDYHLRESFTMEKQNPLPTASPQLNENVQSPTDLLECIENMVRFHMFLRIISLKVIQLY